MQDLKHGFISTAEHTINSVIEEISGDNGGNTTRHHRYRITKFDKVNKYYEWGIEGSDLYYITRSNILYMVSEYGAGWESGQNIRGYYFCPKDWVNDAATNRYWKRALTPVHPWRIWVMPDTSTEEYYNKSTIESSKKVFTFQFPPIKHIVSVDANAIRFIDNHYGEYIVTKDGVVTVIRQPVPADWTVRGCVRYKEPDFVNPGDFQVAADVRNLYNIYCTLAREWKAVNIVRSNPNMYPNKQYRLAEPSVYDQYLASKSTEIKSGEAPEARHFNNLRTGINDSFNMSVAQVNPGDDAYANSQNQLIGALRAMSTTLNSYNSFWDYDDYCALSCQVACQASCTVAAQSYHG